MGVPIVGDMAVKEFKSSRPSHLLKDLQTLLDDKNIKRLLMVKSLFMSLYFSKTHTPILTVQICAPDP